MASNTPAEESRRVAAETGWMTDREVTDPMYYKTLVKEKTAALAEALKENKMLHEENNGLRKQLEEVTHEKDISEAEVNRMRPMVDKFIELRDVFQDDLRPMAERLVRFKKIFEENNG